MEKVLIIVFYVYFLHVHGNTRKIIYIEELAFCISQLSITIAKYSSNQLIKRKMFVWLMVLEVPIHDQVAMAMALNGLGLVARQHVMANVLGNRLFTS